MASRILVIDDELAVRDAFEGALRDLGYAVETAATGEEGLRKARDRRPDMVFLDLRMPGIDGVETLRRLQGCCAGVPVYIVTAFRSDFTRQLKKAAEEGLTFQITDKPIDIDQIQTLARGTLEGPVAG